MQAVTNDTTDFMEAMDSYAAFQPHDLPNLLQLAWVCGAITATHASGLANSSERPEAVVRRVAASERSRQASVVQLRNTNDY